MSRKFHAKNITYRVNVHHIPDKYILKNKWYDNWLNTDHEDFENFEDFPFMEYKKALTFEFDMLGVPTDEDFERIFLALERLGFVFLNSGREIITVTFQNKMSKEDVSRLLPVPQRYVQKGRIICPLTLPEYHRPIFHEFARDRPVLKFADWSFYLYDGIHITIKLPSWTSIVPPPDLEEYYDFLERRASV